MATVMVFKIIVPRDIYVLVWHESYLSAVFDNIGQFCITKSRNLIIPFTSNFKSDSHVFLTHALKENEKSHHKYIPSVKLFAYIRKILAGNPIKVENEIDKYIWRSRGDTKNQHQLTDRSKWC